MPARNRIPKTEKATERFVTKWLFENYLVRTPQNEAEVECIVSQDLSNLDAVVEHYRAMESGEEGTASDDGLGFVLTSLVECHEGPHTFTCPTRKDGESFVHEGVTITDTTTDETGRFSVDADYYGVRYERLEAEPVHTFAADPQDEHDLPSRKLDWRPAVLTIDDEETYVGQISDQKWNGWECPRFTKAVTERIVESNNDWDDNDRMEWVEDRIRVVYVGNGEEEISWIDPDADGMYHIGSWSWVWSKVADLAPADTYYAPAEIAIQIDENGEVVSCSVLPREGDPGYFGPKLDEQVWSAVQRHFDEISIGDGVDALIPLRWEG